MQIEFDSNQQPLVQDKPEVGANFVARQILKTSFVDEPKVANQLSIVVAIGLVILCLLSIYTFFIPEEIDSRFYFDPENAGPDA